jgi:hypothetical protein
LSVEKHSLETRRSSAFARIAARLKLPVPIIRGGGHADAGAGATGTTWGTALGLTRSPSPHQFANTPACT